MRTQKSLLACLLLVVPTLLAVAADDETDPVGATPFVVGFHALPREVTEGGLYMGGVVRDVNPVLHFAVVETAAPALFLTLAGADEAVRYVEEDRTEQWIRLVPDDPMWGDQYGPEQVRADEVWDTTLGSTGKNVCIVDTGVRYTHQEFDAVRWLGGKDYVNDDDDPMDDQGHGTHVASTAAGGVNDGVGIAGIANVGVLGVKVLDSQGYGSYSDIASGIQWCADNGGDVISMSLGGSHAQAMADAVVYARDAGSLIVAAAGNSGPCSDCISYPAKYDDVIAVTCTTSTEAQCSFSSDGPESELAAPGKLVKAAWRTSDTAYNTIDGTSMSTPHVSGVAALVWSSAPDLTAADLRQLLRDNARDVGDVGWDEMFGYGIVDAKATFDAANGTPGLPPPIQNPVLIDGFEADSGNWTTDGLWHRSDACSDAVSPSMYLGFHDAGCDYATGARATGAASFAVDLQNSTVATLRFQHWWETETDWWMLFFGFCGGEFDLMRVQAQPAGQTEWDTLRQWDSCDGNGAAWQGQQLNLNGYAGDVVEVRFWFDTLDGSENGYAGWYIDDVEVTADDINAPNLPPVAIAGPDQLLRDADGTGVEEALLADAGSYDLDGIITAYDWYEGDTLLASGEEVTVNLSVGEHLIRLQVTDHENGTGNDTLLVTVLANAPPSASFGLSCRNLACELDGSTSGDMDGHLVAWQWDFGDGAGAAGETTAHSYSTEGTYTATLTVTDNGGATASYDVTFQVQAADLLLGEDFDDEAAQGFSMDGRWHVADDCAEPPSAPGHLGYHDGLTCIYHTTLDEVGTATVAVDMTGHALGRLRFSHHWDTVDGESGLDTMQVQVSPDGSGWTDLAAWDGASPEPPAWTQEERRLDDHVADTLYLRFRFDSGDRVAAGATDLVGFGGWSVDDLEVYGDHLLQIPPPGAEAMNDGAQEDRHLWPGMVAARALLSR